MKGVEAMSRKRILFLASPLIILALSIPGLCSEAELFLKAGLNSLRSGDYESALNAFNQALKADPENPQIIYYKAVAEFNLNRTDEAMRDFRRAYELVSERPPSLELIPSDGVSLRPTHRDGWRVILKPGPRKGIKLEGGSSYRVAVERKGRRSPWTAKLLPLAIILILVAAR
ncbi:hypothetical protein DRP77_11660 [Candidatus Poribacteria bacterium]|nr:MAG: hypothetical protein DRP77_11660 [Candidatus Poribacteria bacterium]